jgi:uncharacterized protein (TIGR03435 family)
MDVHRVRPRFRRPALIRAVAGTGLTLLALNALGQQEPAPAFEVTSVKLAPQDFRQRSGRFGCSTGGGFAAGSMTLTAIIRFAYRVEYFQILGGQAWAADERFEVEGRPSTPVSGTSSVIEDQCRLKLQSLLRERFKLVLRRESREIPAYALMVDKNEPKINKVANSDTAVNGPGFTLNGTPMQMFDPKLTGWSMQQLAQALGIAGLERPVVDRTGLEGIYKIALDFQRRDTTGDGVDATTAVREQLGLRLESSTARFEMLVIDHVQKPDPN